MKSPDGISRSTWMDSATQRTFDAVSGVTRADVVVVGAGISGLTSAYLLLKEGRSVIVLDEGQVGSGQTERTSAHLASAIDDRFYELERLYGVETSKLAYESHSTAIDTIERIAREEKIDCDFVRLNAYLFALPNESCEVLDTELESAKKAGFRDVEKVEKINLCGYETGPCLRFGDQARFHPTRYLAGLADAITRLGGQIFSGKRVIDASGSQPEKNTPAKVTLDDQSEISADHIVVATNTPAPINDWLGIYLKQAAYRTYAIGMTVPRGAVTDALYWDTGDPYHYVRLEGAIRPLGVSADEDVLIVGGEDHKVGQMPHGSPPRDPYVALEGWTREKFPMVKAVTHRWSGQVQEPSDGLGYIGVAPTKGINVYVITGDSGMGLTHGTLGGLLITDLIAGRANAWEKIYSPTRRSLNTDLFKENINTATQYIDLIKPGEISKPEDLAPGEGALLREGLRQLAVYRDDAGAVHKCSAICTHLECVVHWNHFEKTWDCPCHGSRFDPKGKVLMGPAVDDLKKA